MVTFGGLTVHAALHRAFEEAGIAAYARRVEGKFIDYEIAIDRSASESESFEVFRAVSDSLVSEQLLDPGRECLTWLGRLDIIPASFIRIGALHDST